MDFSDHLAKYKKQSGLTTEKLSELSGVPRGTINKLLNGETRNPRIDTVEMLANALGCPVSVLLSGEDSSGALSHLRVIANQQDIVPISGRRIPLLGEIAAGVPIFTDPSDPRLILCPDTLSCDFALQVHGDSMIGARIYDGDFVFIRAQDDVDDGQIAAVVIDDTATLKRVYHIKNGLQLLSENPQYPPMLFTFPEYDSIRILGKAVGFQSRL